MNLLNPTVAIYVATAVALAVWLGVFTFLWRIDQTMHKLRRRLDEEPVLAAPAPRATLEGPKQTAAAAEGAEGRDR